MRFSALAALAGVTSAVAAITPAHALVIDGVLDPLHGYCTSVTCADATQSGNTVTTAVGTGQTFTGAHFGFSVSNGPQSGAFYIVVAEPNNAALATPLITGKIGANTVPPETITTGTAFKWTSGDLDTVTPIAAQFPSASPTNPIGNFLPFTQNTDKGATSYNLVLYSLGKQTLPSPSAETAANMDLSIAGLSTGSMIFGFFDEQTIDKKTGATVDNWIATASSGVLYDDAGLCTDCGPTPFQDAPEPSTLAVLGFGVLGMGFAVRRRQ